MGNILASCWQILGIIVAVIGIVIGVLFIVLLLLGIISAVAMRKEKKND